MGEADLHISSRRKKLNDMPMVTLSLCFFVRVGKWKPILGAFSDGSLIVEEGRLRLSGSGQRMEAPDDYRGTIEAVGDEQGRTRVR